MVSYDGYYEYTPVAVQKEKVQKQLKKLRKKHPEITPVVIEGRTIAKTWWGKAWNSNLESYADYSNRLSRGRSYVRTGCVLDLQIQPGLVTALVQGSRKAPYRVEVSIEPISGGQYDSIVRLCDSRIGDLEQLLAGKFPQELARVFTLQGEGLFPSDKEIGFSCSCPDWASMCKHVTAVLYGVGARFDQDPTLFFTLRAIDFRLLLKKTIEEKRQSMLENAGKASHRALTDVDIQTLFGL